MSNPVTPIINDTNDEVFKKGPKITCIPIRERIRANGEDTMESRPIVLPLIKDGVVALGDLWNCRTNQAAGCLFDKALEKQHLLADPMSSLDYTMHRIKRASDIRSLLKVSAALKVEVPITTGKISIQGAGSFEKDDKSKFNEEHLLFNYEAYTYQVRLRPTVADDGTISELVRNNLETGKIEATHYVDAVILGGKAQGNIKFSEIIDDKKMAISGSFDVKIPLGTVNIEAKASLDMLDENKGESLDVSVVLQSQPRVPKAPTSCAEMYDAIDQFDEIVDKEQHFPQLIENGKFIKGVPILYRLLPISNILDLEQDQFYKMLQQELLDNYTDMVYDLQDYSDTEFIKTLLIESQPKIVPILLDDANPLTKAVMKYASDISDAAIKLKQHASIQFMNYKEGKLNMDDLQLVITDYNDNFKPHEIQQTILDFAEKGRAQLNEIRASDVNGIVDDNGEPAIRFFSNLMDKNEWYNPERTIKILLETKSGAGSPNGVFLKLYDMSPALAKKGIEVGVAFPNISEDFCLRFKSQHSEVVYPASEIRFMLHVMAVAVDTGDSISRLFYSLNATLSGLKLPMEDFLHDIPNLVTVMKEYKDTIICESYLELLAQLLETNNKWNFVIPIQALYTSVEMMRFYRQLRVAIPEKFGIRVQPRWLVSRFPVTDKHFSPLLFVFRDNILQAVCLDQLDLLILMEQLGKLVPDLSLISYDRMKESCIYPPRADFATSIVPNVILDHQTKHSDPVEPLPQFPENDAQHLPSALEITRVGCLRDERMILTSVTRLALKDYQDKLLPFLIEYGWEDNEYSSKKWKTLEWGEYYKGLKDVINTIFPMLLQVSLSKEAIDELKLSPEEGEEEDPDFDANEAIDEIIKFLDNIGEGVGGSGYRYRKIRSEAEELELLLILKEEVESYNGLVAAVRKVGISRAFGTFIQSRSSFPDMFDLYQLQTLAEGLKDEELKSLKPYLLLVCKRYCQRVALDDAEYPRASRRISDSLTEGQLFKTIGVLGEVSYNRLLYILHQELFNFTSLPAPTNAKSFIDKMTRTGLDESQLEVIWTNPKFLYMLRQVMSNESILESLLIHIHQLQQKPIPDPESDEEEIEMEEKAVGDPITLVFPFFIPTDITEKLKPLIASMAVPQFDWEKEWRLVQVMIEQFQIIVTRRYVPLDFMEVLRQNVEERQLIEKGLAEASCLFYWNKTLKIFDHPWDLYTVDMALKLLLKNNEKEAKGAGSKIPKAQRLKAIALPSRHKKESGAKEENELVLNDIWKNFHAVGKLKPIQFANFIQLDNLRPTTLTEYENVGKSLSSLMPYIMQQLKMINSGKLGPEFVSKFINYPPPGPRPGQIDFGDGIPFRNLGLCLTRGDIQSLIFSLTDPSTTHQLLCSMAKTPIALPLLIPSIELQNGPKDPKDLSKCRLMSPALENIIVTELEQIIPRPHLLKEPFRFVLSLRVGDTKQDLGRSSLINEHLMRNSNIFSCLNEPGRGNGKPLNRFGFLEFTWLSATTCHPSFWSQAVKAEYNSDTRKEMILLGDLHGDALSLSSLFEVLKPFVSCFVTFWKVANLTEFKNKKKALQSIIGKSARALDIILYPDPTIVDKIRDENLIFKPIDESGSVINMNKIQKIFAEAIKFSLKHKDGDEGEDGGKNASSSQSFLSFTGLTQSSGAKGAKPLSTIAPVTIDVYPQLSTEESRDLLAFIENNTIGNIQKAIAAVNPDEEDFGLVAAFLEKFAKLLASPNLINSLTHLVTDLDFLSRTSSAESVARLNKLRFQIEDKLVHENPGEEWIIEVQEELKWALEQLRLNSMSLQDIFRTLWSRDMDEVTKTELIKSYSASLEKGFPIEIFHPTYQTHPFNYYVTETFSAIPRDTRVFVLSALGVKGSGKSALLNRLFGQSFTEHSTTFGVKLRLVWLNEELKEYLDCDAFLVLDSEGIGNVENKFDESVDNLERKFTTFILGVSDVVLTTVKGSSMKEISPILEVAFTGLSKLEKVPITPDIYLIQHLIPEQVEDNNLASEFASTLQNSTEVMTSKELEIGIRSRPAHRLHVVKSRNKHGELIKKLKALDPNHNEQKEGYLSYHDDVQKLYKTIIHAAFTTRQKRLSLSSWQGQCSSVWKELESQSFAFASSSALNSAILFQERVEGVKKAIDAAFLYHEKKAEGRLLSGDGDGSNGLDKLFENYEQDFDSSLDIRFNATIIAELRKVVNTCDDMEETASKSKSRRRLLRLSAAAEANPNACPSCSEAFDLRESLFSEVVGKKRGFLTVEEITDYMNSVRDSIVQRIRQSIISRQLREGKSRDAGDLKKKLNEALELFPGDVNEQRSYYLKYISTLQTVIPARHRLDAELKQVYRNLPQIADKHFPKGRHIFPDLEQMLAFDVQIYNVALESAINARKAERMSWVQHDWLLSKLEDIPRKMRDDFESVLYRPGMARTLKSKVQEVIALFEEFCGERLLPTFQWEVHDYAIQLFSRFVEEQQNFWDTFSQEDSAEDVKLKGQGNNPLHAFMAMKSKFPDLFLD